MSIFYFDSHCPTGVDYHCENELSSRENGEQHEKDSDYEPESDSNSESDKSSTDDDDDEDKCPPDLQEVSDDFESGSNDEEANETIDKMPELQAKKLRETALEYSDNDSESDK